MRKRRQQTHQTQPCSWTLSDWLLLDAEGEVEEEEEEEEEHQNQEDEARWCCRWSVRIAWHHSVFPPPLLHPGTAPVLLLPLLLLLRPRVLFAVGHLHSPLSLFSTPPATPPIHAWRLPAVKRHAWNYARAPSPGFLLPPRALAAAVALAAALALAGALVAAPADAAAPTRLEPELLATPAPRHPPPPRLGTGVPWSEALRPRGSGWFGEGGRVVAMLGGLELPALLMMLGGQQDIDAYLLVLGDAGSPCHSSSCSLCSSMCY